MLKKFTFEEIGELDDGRIKVAFEQALHEIIEDMKDRPGTKKPRKLLLSLSFSPVIEGNDLDSVNVGFAVKPAIPQRESKTYNMRAAPGGLLVNDASPENVRQATLDMAPRPSAQVETGSRQTPMEGESDVG